MDTSYTNAQNSATSGRTYPVGTAGTADPTLSTGTRDQRSTGQKVKDAINPDTRTGTEATTPSGAAAPGTTGRGSGISAPFAAVHGVGEKIRGEFNAGVDRAFNEPSGEVKNDAVAREGDREMATGRFTGATKERELGGGQRRI